MYYVYFNWLTNTDILIVTEVHRLHLDNYMNPQLQYHTESFHCLKKSHMFHLVIHSPPHSSHLNFLATTDLFLLSKVLPFLECQRVGIINL